MTTYTFITLDAPVVDAVGINDLGQIVGSARTVQGHYYEFLYSGGNYTTIDPPGDVNGVSPGRSNDLGQIVGAYANGITNVGFLYSSGSYTPLFYPTAVFSTFASGINDKGQVVGSYGDRNALEHGFLYEGGVYSSFDDPLATAGTWAYDINYAGQIVGNYVDNAGSHGFLYSGGTYITIDDPFAGSGGTFARGVNDAGQIVGYYFDTQGLAHGFLDTNGVVTTIDDNLGVNGTLIEDINNAGQIVGSHTDGNGAGHGFLATVSTNQPPATVQSIVVAPSTGDLGPNATVTLAVNFNEAVTVAGGTPSMILNDGGLAMYQGGSGSSALVFTYTVGALGSGENTSDLAMAVSNALSLNGATISDETGNAADLSGADGYNPTGILQIDTTSPNVSTITAATDNGLTDLNTGHVVTITVTTNEIVNVTGIPTLQLNDSEVAKYVSGTGTNTLNFSYAVQSGDSTPDLKVTRLNLPSAASIQDGAGNNLSGPITQDLALQIDTINPIVTSASASPSYGDFRAGDKIAITLTMSGPVKVKGIPALTFDDGGTANFNASSSNPATGVLVFSYTVKAGQNTSNLKITSVDLPVGASVTDAAGHIADFANALTTFNGSQIDTTAPTVVSIATSGAGIDHGDGYLGLNSVVTLTANFSEAVTVDTSNGVPALNLNDGGKAVYVSGSGTGALSFMYTVAAKQATSDLTVTGLTLKGGSIADGAGNKAVLSGAQTNPIGVLQIDGNAPVVKVHLASDTGISHSDSITASATIAGTGAPNTIIQLIIDGTANAATALVNSLGQWFFTPAFADGLHTVVATETDAAGNMGTSSPLTFTLDTTAPTVVSVTDDANSGVLGIGDTVSIKLQFSEAVFATGTLTLTLNDGGKATYDAVKSFPLFGQLVFDDVVAPGQHTGDLTVNGVNGQIKDLAGNAFVFSEPQDLHVAVQVPERYTLGLDAITNVNSAASVQKIADAGFHFIAQYLGAEETKLPSVDVAGIPIVSLFERGKTMADTQGRTGWIKHFSTAIDTNKNNLLNQADPSHSHTLAENSGYSDAEAAAASAHLIGQPQGSAIYFALDLDEPSILSGGVQDYFKGVNEYFSQPGNEFIAGVYGAADTVAAVMNSHGATYTWVSRSWPDPNGLHNLSNLYQDDVAKADVSQYANNHITIAGISADVDYAKSANFHDYGAWLP